GDRCHAAARRNRGQGNGQRRVRNPARPGDQIRTAAVPRSIRHRGPERGHGRLRRETARELEGTLMAKIAFIGLGHMGGGMAPNLARAGHEVRAFDLVPEAMEKAAEGGCSPAASAAEAVKEADVVITMLPASRHVRLVYHDDVAPNAKPGSL